MTEYKADVWDENKSKKEILDFLSLTTFQRAINQGWIKEADN